MLHCSTLHKKAINVDLVSYIQYGIKKRMKQAVVIEKLGYDKEVGDMCIFCLRSTGNENIPVCLNCILSENFYHSLGILKQMLRDKRKTQT